METPVENRNEIDHSIEIPVILGKLSKAHEQIVRNGLDPKLHHLIQLRASQINKCAYCIGLHISEAKADGETDARLNNLIVWDTTDHYSDKERAALAWTEALTNLHVSSKLKELRGNLSKHFSNQEISLMTAAISMINLWNRIQVSQH